MSMTIRRNGEGEPINCYGCSKRRGIIEYGGYCGPCWAELSERRRAVALGENPNECQGKEGKKCGYFPKFHGYCEMHWLKLTPEERSVLEGKEPPIVHQDVIERIIEHHHYEVENKETF